MAFYALLAHDRPTGRWRTCAIFPSGSRDAAALHARSLRDSNILGFVPYPSDFKMRQASRREVSLLLNFMNAVDNSALITFRGDHLESLLGRRRKLMSSFFLGMFLQPEVMKRKYGGALGTSTTTGSSSAGGGEEMEGSREETAQDSLTSSEASSEEPHEQSDVTVEGDVSAEDGALTDASQQEAALDALLSSSADQPIEGADEMDLDFL